MIVNELQQLVCLIEEKPWQTIVACMICYYMLTGLAEVIKATFNKK